MNSLSAIVVAVICPTSDAARTTAHGDDYNVAITRKHEQEQKVEPLIMLRGRSEQERRTKVVILLCMLRDRPRISSQALNILLDVHVLTIYPRAIERLPFE